MACGQKFSIGQMQTLLRQTGFDESLIIPMSAIGQYESSGCSGVINDGSSTNSVEYSVGLWQINTRVHKNYTVQQLTNPEINAKEALRIYRLQGFRAWLNSYNKYKSNYLGIAQQAKTIYGGGSSNPVVTANQIPNLLNSPLPTVSTENAKYQEYALYGALALAVLIITR